ncbi:MAG: hydantoinase/oxoprolinase family protein [Proteobacteria bacterium]|nr:hydantoinase/oxoprolinase family protein [Pseudomonadota bacterium]
MIIGIDVGGTHADGVLLDGDKLLGKHKVSVDQQQLSDVIITLLQHLVPGDRSKLTRIHLSSTLCTNAIVTGSLEPVGMLIQAGPGMNPDFFARSCSTWFLDGAIDHRGQILRDPDPAKIDAAAVAMLQEGINSIGIVTKFSHRNNRHELQVAERLAGHFAHVSMGHRISGLPNFPRRVYSTWLNGALSSQFNLFKNALEQGLRHLGITCPCHVLKADGGTIPFSRACEFPCESVHSGPSASVMGCLALSSQTDDAVLLDIGGTTTDIALLVDGAPLLEPYGVNVAGRPTLIRALKTTSIGLGGDSRVAWHNGTFRIGPERQGTSMAEGGSAPTPTDAMVVLGKLSIGSQQKAGMAMLALCPREAPEYTATLLLESFAQHIRLAVETMIEEVFARPVYTVAALLHRRRIQPRQIVAIGGPAEALQPFLSESLFLPCTVPANYEVANAIGAARARLTVQATLYADTGDGRLSIPEISCLEKIASRFTMPDAEKRLKDAIDTMVAEMGMKTCPEIDFLERLEMNVVRGFSTSGKILTLKAQIRPGLTTI